MNYAGFFYIFVEYKNLVRSNNLNISGCLYSRGLLSVSRKCSIPDAGGPNNHPNAWLTRTKANPKLKCLGPVVRNVTSADVGPNEAAKKPKTQEQIIIPTGVDHRASPMIDEPTMQ